MIIGILFLFVYMVALEIRSSALERRCVELEEKNEALEKALDEVDEEETKDF